MAWRNKISPEEKLAIEQRALEQERERERQVMATMSLDHSFNRATQGTATSAYGSGPSSSSSSSKHPDHPVEHKSADHHGGHHAESHLSISDSATLTGPSSSNKPRNPEDIFLQRGHEDEVQTISPHTGEPLNPVRAAMERAGLRHVPYGRTKQLSEVRPPLPQHVQESEQKALAKEGNIRPDEPDLVRSLLKWYSSDIAQKRRVFTDFFLQWTLEQLVLLRLMFQAHSASQPLEVDRLSVGHEEEPFVKRWPTWRDLLLTNPYSLALLDEVIELKEKGEGEIDKEALWWMLVRDYESYHERKSQAKLEATPTSSK